MADTEALVERHYSRPGFVARVLAALAAEGVAPTSLRAADLFPYDQLHGRGIVATREHAARAGLGAGMRVLDLGCGIGGASRYLATECGCAVTGIDLTAEFIEAAQDLSARCGLAGKIEFRQASALALPFPAAGFDHVWCHNVTMNIADKAGFADEVARVLRPGGRLSCIEVNQGPGGAPHFPLPWASDPSYSFLVTPEAMAAALEAAGLRVLERVDLGPLSRAFAVEAAARAQRGERPVNANQLIMGEDFSVRQRNSARSSAAGCTLEQFVLAEKPAR